MLQINPDRFGAAWNQLSKHTYHCKLVLAETP